MANNPETSHVVGGVDTHKDLHVAAVVDHYDRVLGTESFPTTRHGYRLMLNWMRSFGDLQRVGIECSGSYGAGLLRYLQTEPVPVAIDISKAPHEVLISFPGRKRRQRLDASLIKADANKQNSTPKEEWNAKQIEPADAPRALREYLGTLDEAAFGAASEVQPKFTSHSDPASQWTAAHEFQNIRLVRADICIITNNAPSHMRGIDTVARRKANIVDTILLKASNSISVNGGVKTYQRAAQK